MGTNKKSFGTRTNLSTSGTGLGSKVGTDFNSLYSTPQSFVGNELLELVERPSVEPEVKFSAFSNIPYTFEVFQNNSSSFAVIHNLLTYYMIPIPHKPLLSARDLFEQSFGRTSAFGLEFSTNSFELNPLEFDLPCVEELPIACYSNLVYSYINTQKSVRISWELNVPGKCDMQEQFVLSVKDKVSIPGIPVKILPIVFRNINRNFEPAIGGSKRNTIKIKAKGTSIISYCKHFLEVRLCRFLYFPQRFKSLTSLVPATANKLSRKFKNLSNRIVSKVMKFPLGVNSIFPASINNILCRLGVLPHSLKKLFFTGNFKFYCNNRFHVNTGNMLVYKFYTWMSSVQWYNKKEVGIPPITKVMGILPDFL